MVPPGSGVSEDRSSGGISESFPTGVGIGSLALGCSEGSRTRRSFIHSFLSFIRHHSHPQTDQICIHREMMMMSSPQCLLVFCSSVFEFQVLRFISFSCSRSRTMPISRKGSSEIFCFSSSVHLLIIPSDGHLHGFQACKAVLRPAERSWTVIKSHLSAR